MLYLVFEGCFLFNIVGMAETGKSLPNEVGKGVRRSF
jgi:hypothetical protein